MISGRNEEFCNVTMCTWWVIDDLQLIKMLDYLSQKKKEDGTACIGKNTLVDTEIVSTSSYQKDLGFLKSVYSEYLLL